MCRCTSKKEKLPCRESYIPTVPTLYIGVFGRTILPILSRRSLSHTYEILYKVLRIDRAPYACTYCRFCVTWLKAVYTNGHIWWWWSTFLYYNQVKIKLLPFAKKTGVAVDSHQYIVSKSIWNHWYNGEPQIKKYEVSYYNSPANWGSYSGHVLLQPTTPHHEPRRPSPTGTGTSKQE